MQLETLDHNLLPKGMSPTEARQMAEAWLERAAQMPDGPEQIRLAQSAFFILDNLHRLELEQELGLDKEEQQDSASSSDPASSA